MSVERPLVWLAGAVKSPPFSLSARLEAGFRLRLLQEGVMLAMPVSRPMPSIGPGCHELRIDDDRQSWRIVYRCDEDAVVIVEVFAKTTAATPRRVLDLCRRRLRAYDTL